MLHKLALSASVLALAGSLAVAQPTAYRPLDGGDIVAFDDALASLRYL